MFGTALNLGNIDIDRRPKGDTKDELLGIGHYFARLSPAHWYIAFVPILVCERHECACARANELLVESEQESRRERRRARVRARERG